MQENIPFAKPFIGKEEEEAVLRVLRSGWITTGTEALSFEKEFAALLSGGATPSLAVAASRELTALAVNSATSGLHLALEAAGIGAGDVVIVPSYTFAATAEAALYCGAEVAFVDVCAGGFDMDAAALEEAIKRLNGGLNAHNGKKGPKGRPKAVIPVHFGGLPCRETKKIIQIAKKYGLAVIEDAAHALPAALPGGGYAGTAGDIGVYSFYATKTITTGEGGMVVSANPGYIKRMSVMRLHGIDRPVWNRYSGTKAAWRYEVTAAGFKYNMPDILAAIGRVQLKRSFELLETRKAIAARYDAAFSPDNRFEIPPTAAGDAAGDARHLYPLRLSAVCPVSRDECVSRLQEAGIGVSVHFIPLHTMPFYKERYGLEEDDFPESMRSFKREISLPLWPGMTDAQIERVIRTVIDVCR